MVTFLRTCPASQDHLEGFSSVLQYFLESFYHFAFLRTDGAGTSIPPCSKMLAQYVCCPAVADTLPPSFTEKCNVEKRSLFLSVMFFRFTEIRQSWYIPSIKASAREYQNFANFILQL